MASALDGLLQQKETYIQKLNYLRKELAIASDASQKFTLQMQIAEVEKEMEIIDAKLVAIPSKNPSNASVKEENPYDRLLKFFKKSWIIAILLFIFLLITKGDEFVTAFDNLKNRFLNDSKDTIAQPVLIPTDTSKTPTIIKPPITEASPKPTKPDKNPPAAKKYISVRLVVDIAYEKAIIFANNIQIEPVNNAPTIKELNIEYNGKPIVLKIQTPEKTCTHTILVSDDYFINPKTIEKICSQ